MSFQTTQTVQWYASHTRYLKSLDAAYRTAHGPNPELPLWGDKPRTGSKWHLLEEKDLLIRLKAMTDQSTVLAHYQLAELAWYHGRSSDGIEQRLRKLIGSGSYYRLFNFE